MENGSLVISLDYELMWGMLDVAEKDGYGMTNIANVPKAINRMLTLLNRYGVHATFATVGMIMYHDRTELLADIPDLKPSYDIQERSPYNGAIDNIAINEYRLFFQPDVIENLKIARGIEVGTHTYCHYYCWEQGQTIEQFDADIKKACDLANRNGIELKSIIFPRNQVSPEHLKVCARYGITSYRGNALKYFNEPKSKFEHYKNKFCRLLDAYINVGGMTTVPYCNIDVNEQPLNLMASRMLRPYSPKLSMLEGLRLKRMKREMLHAAKYGEMYHIWWHPHNFGANLEQNLNFLEELLKYFNYCSKNYGMKSYTMNELREELINEHHSINHKK